MVDGVQEGLIFDNGCGSNELVRSKAGAANALCNSKSDGIQVVIP